MVEANYFKWLEFCTECHSLNVCGFFCGKGGRGAGGIKDSLNFDFSVLKDENLVPHLATLPVATCEIKWVRAKYCSHFFYKVKTFHRLFILYAMCVGSLINLVFCLSFSFYKTEPIEPNMLTLTWPLTILKSFAWQKWQF